MDCLPIQKRKRGWRRPPIQQYERDSQARKDQHWLGSGLPGVVQNRLDENAKPTTENTMYHRIADRFI